MGNDEAIFEVCITMRDFTYKHEIKDIEDYEIFKSVCERLQEKAYKIVQGNQPTLTNL